MNSSAIVTRLTTDIPGMEIFVDRTLELIPNWASLIAGVAYLGCTVGAATFLVVIPIFGIYDLPYCLKIAANFSYSINRAIMACWPSDATGAESLERKDRRSPIGYPRSSQQYQEYSHDWTFRHTRQRCP